MTKTIHSARSPEFLSRLYDGEVDAAERAAFEAHCSGCDECRRAADTFAATLAAFRSSPTAPAAADLSARILRKIRAQSPARRPFGVMFGIDIRWAGVFVAALLVVLLSAPMLLRTPPAAPAPKSPPPIPARLIDALASPEAAQAPPRAAPSEAKPPGAPGSAPAAKKEQVADRADGTRTRSGGGDAPADEEKRRFAPAPRLAENAAPVLRRQAAAGEPSGREAGAMSATETVSAPLRIAVSPMDELGPAPALISRPTDERLAEFRGRDFILIVESQGRVREVQPSPANGRLATMKARPTDASSAAGPADLLRDLRFGPGDRPRRLLVRIE